MTIGQIQCLRVISHKKGHISSPGQAKVFICGKLKIWCSWLNLNGQPIFSLQGTSGLYAWVSGWKLKGSLAQSPGNDLIVVFECAVYLRLHWIYLLRLYSFVPLTIHHNEGLIWKKWRFQITKKSVSEKKKKNKKKSVSDLHEKYICSVCAFAWP